MNLKLFCFRSGSQCDQFQEAPSSSSSSISRAGIRNAIVSYGSAATCPIQQRKKGTRVRRRHPEDVRVGTYDEILIGLVRGFPPRLQSTHEPPTRNDACLDLRQVYLHHHTLLSRLTIPHLSDTITRATDLQKHLALHARLLRRHLQLTLFHVSRCTPRKVRLVLFALCMCKVGSFICV